MIGEVHGTWRIIEIAPYGSRRCECIHCGARRLLTRQGVACAWKWHRGCTLPDPSLASRKALLAKTWALPAGDDPSWVDLAALYVADPVACKRGWPRRLFESVRDWIDNRAAEARSMLAARERTGFRSAWLNGGAP